MGLEERGIFDRRNMKDMNLQLQSRQTEFVASLAQDDILSAAVAPPVKAQDDRGEVGREGTRVPTLGKATLMERRCMGRTTARRAAATRSGVGGGFAGALGDGGRDGGDFDHFEAELAFGDFLEGDVHEGELGVEGDERSKSLAELADPLGDDVDENLGAVDDFEGVLDEGVFHRREGSGRNGVKGKSLSLRRVVALIKLILRVSSLFSGGGATSEGKDCGRVASTLSIGNAEAFARIEVMFGS
jgi:hypothetical protein